MILIAQIVLKVFIDIFSNLILLKKKKKLICLRTLKDAPSFDIMYYFVSKILILSTLKSDWG